MKTLKFITNLKDSKSVESLKDQLDKINGIIEWKVDLNNPGKIITLKVENLSSETIARTIFAAGFRSQEVTAGWKKVAKRLFTKDCCN
ncbi:MAG: hypothetical protein M1480_16055 [Bacteroidetes bacterium]|nr:hypothetical protein [Bacteroidota bacterium]